MAEDLEWLRLHNPRATESDVLRVWARSSARRRMMVKVTEADAKLRAAEEKASQLARELAQARKTLSSFEADEAAADKKEKDRLLGAMSKPHLHDRVLQDLEELADAEKAGLQVPPRIPLLREARDAWGTYDHALQALREVAA